MVRSWSSTRLTIWSFICSFCCRISLGFFSYSVFNLCVKKTHTHQTLQTYFTVVNSKEFDERLQIKSFLLKRRHKERRHRFSSEATKNMSAALHSSLNCLPCFYDMQIPVPLNINRLRMHIVKRSLSSTVSWNFVATIKTPHYS